MSVFSASSSRFEFLQVSKIHFEGLRDFLNYNQYETSNRQFNRHYFLGCLLCGPCIGHISGSSLTVEKIETLIETASRKKKTKKLEIPKRTDCVTFEIQLKFSFASPVFLFFFNLPTLNIYYII